MNRRSSNSQSRSRSNKWLIPTQSSDQRTSSDKTDSHPTDDKFESHSLPGVFPTPGICNGILNNKFPPRPLLDALRQFTLSQRPNCEFGIPGASYVVLVVWAQIDPRR